MCNLATRYTREKYTDEKFLGIKGTAAANGHKTLSNDRISTGVLSTEEREERNEVPDAAKETGTFLPRELGCSS